MIAPEAFCQALKQAGVQLFAGVPDSLLANLCAYIDDHCTAQEHIITANEGNAVALAAGYHLATGRYACVYMQNSGLGNTINPLTSLTDPEVYRIPLLMVIGWRGEPGVKDEPQHVKQGRITPAQLDLLEIPYWILEADSDLSETLSAALTRMTQSNAPVALLVRKDTFSKYKSTRLSNANLPAADLPAANYSLTREMALATLLELSGDDLVVSTTGKTSREVFELRASKGEAQRDFLTVGAMGHTASIALGVALGNPDKRVICIDGDGSLLMHLGALPIIGSLKPANLIHVLLNNGAHESVGGQPTVAHSLDFHAITMACGYSGYRQASTTDEIAQAWASLSGSSGPALLEITIAVGSRDDLGRPTSTPEENKRAFMRAADV
ncbi:phosphonopyruvate decarboxylase [Nitrincola alkalilacustris]|uniref:phosphonopyruvate decarboxylase n=1 Tax=Nitrincola alkalilacustris TaxID=1571224 RepID=UPI00124C3AAB|nr:phosphonopyruvate decarboxylase [Nitrincola alkalilacustris]